MLALAFASGGFLPGPVALAAVVLAIVLLVRLTIGQRAWGPLSPAYVAGATALALLAVWTLLSAEWSDAPARALIEYDRALLFLLGFLVLGSIGRTPSRLRWALRGVAAAAFAICLCGLITRLAPDVWAVEPGIAPGRLSYPLGYWNALGLLAAIGIVLSFALTCDDRESPVGRVLAAAALPVMAATLLLTFSRGAIAAAIIGLVVLLLAARPRALPSGVLVAAPAVAVAVMSAYGANLLASDAPTSAAATAQGHDTALVVALCALLAAVARAVLLPLDRRLARLRAPAALHRPAVLAGVGGTFVLAVVAAALMLGAPDVLQRQYDRFLAVEVVDQPGGDLRSRLTNPGSNGRVEMWEVGLAAFSDEPLRGRGAGTYALEWDRLRPVVYQVEDGHSLYVEMLADLGIVGLALLAVALLLILGGFLARARGPDRVVGGALFAAAVAWALHAGIDWDWEMPAITFWLFAVGGLALAAPAGAAAGRGVAPLGRIVLALGCLVLALVPARVFMSEGPLRDSARAFERGDCVTAIDRALASTSALEVRPEPFVLLGYCDVRIGRPDLAVAALEHAVRRDPGNWEGHYGLALVRAAGGIDPRPALRRAQRLNPLEPLLRQAERRFATEDPQTWRRRALSARLPQD